MEHDIWEKEEDLENMKKVVVEFEGRLSTEVRRQEKLSIVKERSFRREELPEKYMVKILYRWNNGKFEKEYLRKLERNWWKWKSVFLEKKPWKESNIRVENSGLYLFLFLFFIYFIFQT